MQQDAVDTEILEQATAESGAVEEADVACPEPKSSTFIPDSIPAISKMVRVAGASSRPCRLRRSSSASWLPSWYSNLCTACHVTAGVWLIHVIVPVVARLAASVSGVVTTMPSPKTRVRVGRFGKHVKPDQLPLGDLMASSVDSPNDLCVARVAM
jgi:hypothetical protein